MPTVAGQWQAEACEPSHRSGPRPGGRWHLQSLLRPWCGWVGLRGASACGAPSHKGVAGLYRVAAVAWLPSREGWRGHTLPSLSRAERGPRELTVGPGKGSHHLSACASGARPAKQCWQDAWVLGASRRVTRAFGIPGYSLLGSMSRPGAGCPGGPCHTPSVDLGSLWPWRPQCQPKQHTSPQLWNPPCHVVAVDPRRMLPELLWSKCGPHTSVFFCFVSLKQRSMHSACINRSFLSR